MDLRSFQSHFSKFLYTRRPEENSILWIRDALANDDKIEAGLKIYRNNLLVTLVDTLGDTFPCTKQFLDNEFYNVAKKFIYSFPSKNGDLNIYGQKFSTFLNNSSYQYKNFLASLAELEWTWEQCLYAKDDEDLSKEGALKLIQNKGDDVRFCLKKSVAIFCDNYGAFSHWQGFRHGQRRTKTFIPMAISDEKFYILWKDHSIRKIQEIENPLLTLLIELRDTKSLSEISKIELCVFLTCGTKIG